MAVQNKNLNRY